MPESANEHITRNLISFYQELSRLGGLETGTFAGIPYVNNQSGNWPGYLLQGESIAEKNAEEIAEAMSSDRIPPFWIMESAPGKNTEQMLSEHGIRMINYWTGMYQEASDVKKPVQPRENCKLRRLSRQNEIDLWVELVNEVIMTSAQLDTLLFRKLLYSNDFYFYGLWKGDEILSTTLIFVQHQTAGLYFVATRAEQQGKGYGTAISNYAMHDAKAAGAEKFVLHSTREGLQLYQKTGFREINRYDIYWLLGKR